MPIKKLIKGLKESLKKERNTKHTTLIGKWWGKWKAYNIEARIEDLERELKRRKRNG